MVPALRLSKVTARRARGTSPAKATRRVRPQTPSIRPTIRIESTGMPFKKKLFLMVSFSLLAAIMTIVFREAIAGLGSWGYLGAFIISLISSATILFPAPGGAAVVLMGRDFNPYALGVASGVGFALGSVTAYYVGMQATNTFATNRFLRWAGNAMERFGPPIIFTFNLIPVLPMDFVGLTAGATRYPLIKYLWVATMANTIKMVSLILLSSTSWALMEDWIGNWGGS
ncbi:MAG: VTT domain-containing protein [Chloroflexota bacterium]|nr:VTT domain-containing protein [Chloroflexota bacterium]